MMKITPDIAELIGAYFEGGELTQEELTMVQECINVDEQFSEQLANQITINTPDLNNIIEDVVTDSSFILEGINNPIIHNTDMNTIQDIQGMFGNEYQQEYADTCAIKSQQIILNEFGIPVTEDQLVTYSYQHGWYNGHGTAMEDVGRLLVDGGIPVHRQENANVFDLVSELAQGHKVIVGVDADELWGSRFMGWLEDFYQGEAPDHALIVSGIDTRDPNNVMVLVTDPGTGDHNKAYPLEQFMDAWSDSQCFMVATDIPVPDSVPEMMNFDYSAGHLDYIAGLPYLEFEIFHGLSDALPIYAMTEMGYYSPMSSLYDAYSDVATQQRDFADIFANYDFNNYLDTDTATANLINTYHSGIDYINFSPEMSWDTYTSAHNIDVYSNDIYADFLCDSINYFEAIGDYESFNYCSQQLYILDYCDYNNIDFYDTFYC